MPRSAPPRATSTVARRVTGMDVTPPEPAAEAPVAEPGTAESSTIGPAALPGDGGPWAVTVTVRLWPGPSTRVDGETEPNGANRSVAPRQGMIPLVPPTEIGRAHV